MIVPGKGERDLAKFAQSLQDGASGGTNAIRPDIALAPDAAETVVADVLCSDGALPQWCPTSPSAAQAIVWLKAATRGSFTLGHDVSSATDRTFRYEMRRP